MIHVFFLLIYTFFFSISNCNDFSDYKTYKKSKINLNIQKISQEKFHYPWAITFLDRDNILVTEKKGNIFKINTSNGDRFQIKHNIPHIEFRHGQGGLLDVYKHSDGYIYFTYSHDFNDNTKIGRLSNFSSTAVARGKLQNNEIVDLKTLLIAKPKLDTDKHWGARIVIKDDFLFVGFGERDKGMIAQNPQKHPGSIIRIKTDGTIPTDNPAYLGFEDWLPEIYQIGMRNPQGMAISPKNGEIYFSQHGPMGGDNIGIVKFAGNYGWKDIAWGGKEYSGRKIGKKDFKDIYNKNLITWVPSIAVGNIQFYKGETFYEWKENLIVSATKTKLLARLVFDGPKIIDQEIIIKDDKRIGRIRDFEIDHEGNILIISDSSPSYLWKISRDYSMPSKAEQN